MDYQEYVDKATPYRGMRGNSPRVYFAPDPDAPYGRYWDGKAISQHPSETEIEDYWEFWTALANAEQKEVLNAQRDIGVAYYFNKQWKDRSNAEVVQGAIDWWMKHYPAEVRDFEDYLKHQKAIMEQLGGWSKGKQMFYKGAIPPRVKQLVIGVRPSLCQLDGREQSKFDEIFFELAPKALVGGK